MWFFKKLENVLNGSSELLPLFLLYLATPCRIALRHASVEWALLDDVKMCNLK